MEAYTKSLQVQFLMAAASCLGDAQDSVNSKRTAALNSEILDLVDSTLAPVVEKHEAPDSFRSLDHLDELERILKGATARLVRLTQMP